MDLVYDTSTVADGSMKSPDGNYETVLTTRETFLKKRGLDSANTTLVRVTYEADDFCRYFTLTDKDKGDGITHTGSIEADALVVTNRNHALFLPLADCIAAVIHDPTQGILMLSHLGRHNLEQFGGKKSIEYLIQKHDVDPKDLSVWLSPAAGQANYPLYAFDNRSLHDVAVEQITVGGVPLNNITVSPIDSSTDSNYFSHSQFLKGNRDNDGRFAVAAVLS